LAELQRQTAATGRLPTQGVTVELPIPGKVSGFRAADAFVWLPPVWFEKSAPKLPVIILLPGVPGEPSDWTRAAFADQTATRFANAHGGRAPILVMPDPNGSPTQDTECVDSPLGRAATYVNTDVVDFVRHEFDAATGEHSVAVGGLSAGGTCAMILGLRNPDEYTAIASYSGFASPTYQEDDRQQTIDILFGGSASAYAAHDPLQILRTRKFPQLSAWVETGSGDPGPLQDNEKLRPELEAAGVDTCWLVRPGGHDFDFWQTAFAKSLPWLSARLGLTPEPASVPATCQR
jgi:enterochelin esterase-like enzyme